MAYPKFVYPPLREGGLHSVHEKGFTVRIPFPFGPRGGGYTNCGRVPVTGPLIAPSGGGSGKEVGTGRGT